VDKLIGYVRCALTNSDLGLWPKPPLSSSIQGFGHLFQVTPSLRGSKMPAISQGGVVSTCVLVPLRLVLSYRRRDLLLRPKTLCIEFQITHRIFKYPRKPELPVSTVHDEISYAVR
jgi:hypothetical protein